MKENLLKDFCNYIILYDYKYIAIKYIHIHTIHKYN